MTDIHSLEYFLYNILWIYYNFIVLIYEKRCGFAYSHSG